MTPRVAPSAVVLVVARKSDRVASELHAVVHFPLGFPTAPFSVGARGDWALAVPGVADVHLLLRFDGQRVFASRAPAAGPASLDGVALGASWVRLAPPSTITFGEAELRVLEGSAPPSLPAPPRQCPRVVKRCLRWSALLLGRLADGLPCRTRRTPRVR